MATVCHRLRWHVNNFFWKTFPNPTNPQVKPHKKLLSHAARRAIASVSAWIPGRTASAYTIAPTPRPNARIPTRKRARLPTRAHTHAPMPARTRAPAPTRARAPTHRGEGRVKSPHHPRLPSASPLIFLRARNWSLLRNCYGTGERRNTLHRDSGGSAF